MAKVLRSIMGRRDKSSPAPAASPEPEDADSRLQNEGRNIDRRVSISRSGRYKQRDKRRSGIWDNPQLVHEPATPGAPGAPGALGAAGASGAPAAPASVEPPSPPGNDKENGDAGSVRSKDSVRSRGSSVLLDTSQVTQELLDLAEQQLTCEQPAQHVTVTNL